MISTLIFATPDLQKIIKKDLTKLKKKLNISFASHEQDISELLREKKDQIALQIVPDGSQKALALGRHISGARQLKISTITLADFYEMLFQKIPIHIIKNHSLDIKLNISTNPYIKSQFKRLMDIILSLSLIVILFPIFLITPILIRLDSQGPIFFRQKRTGNQNFPFTITKFRTMKVDAEKEGPKWATKNDSRVTFLGRILRKTRIDELPQLFNVLNGEMSLIGPRPERPEFDQILREAIPFYDQRYSQKPGVTGWAQVNFPYGGSVEEAMEKLELDLFYLKNANLWLDIKILWKTIAVILGARGQ